MVERLGQTIRFPVQKLYVDFDDLGWSLSDRWVEVTDYILEIGGSKEKSGEAYGSVTSDIVHFVVDNSDKTFSNDNVNSPFYGKIKSNLKFKLMVGFKAETLQEYASGYIEKISPTWSDNKYSIATTDFFKTFKKTPPPKSSFTNISLEELINALCDTAGLPSHIVRQIPTTEYYYSYFKFTENNCFEALKNLMQICAGICFFEQSKFIVKTKLALNYNLDTVEKYTITSDDLFLLDEPVENNVINDVIIRSNPPIIGAMDTVWKTPENSAQAQGEIIIYNGSGTIYLNPENMPAIDTTDNPIKIRNLTQQKDVEITFVNPVTGKVDINTSFAAVNDILTVSYSYQQLVILAGKTRKFQATLDQETDSIARLDCAVWDKDGINRLNYSTIPDTAGSLSLQSMTFDRDKQVVTFELKNNFADHVTISTLQLVGFPVSRINPIEVHISDGASINEYELQTLTIETSYITNVKLAEKIAQYIIDNNKSPRKKLMIKIDGFPELRLDDVVKVVESKSGTNHKLTVEQINYSFDVGNGWIMDITLIQLEEVKWVYERFYGISFGKINSSDKEDVRYNVELVCYDGNFFRNGQGTKTLIAKVFQGNEEVTSLLNADQFNWRRSSSNEAEDLTWNNTHLGIGPTITIQSTDINKTSVIFCDILA